MGGLSMLASTARCLAVVIEQLCVKGRHTGDAVVCIDHLLQHVVGGYAGVGTTLVGAAMWKRLPTTSSSSGSGSGSGSVRSSRSKSCVDVLHWMHRAMEACMRMQLSQGLLADAMVTVDVYEDFLHRNSLSSASGVSSELVSGVPTLSSYGCDQCLSLLALTGAVASVHSASVPITVVLDKLSAMQV